jgi:hypothetical protein
MTYINNNINTPELNPDVIYHEVEAEYHFKQVFVAFAEAARHMRQFQEHQLERLGVLAKLRGENVNY